MQGRAFLFGAIAPVRLRGKTAWAGMATAAGGAQSDPVARLEKPSQATGMLVG
jgi:hypothetical protein